MSAAQLAAQLKDRMDRLRFPDANREKAAPPLRVAGRPAVLRPRGSRAERYAQHRANLSVLGPEFGVDLSGTLKRAEAQDVEDVATHRALRY